MPDQEFCTFMTGANSEMTIEPEYERVDIPTPGSNARYSMQPQAPAMALRRAGRCWRMHRP